LFGCSRLIRAAETLAECERGIAEGLHVLDFELGGWLKFDDDTSGAERMQI